jgi:dTDP-4-amino-4,6-dideoxygalactose transaminase
MMIARGKLDITYTNIIAGVLYCIPGFGTNTTNNNPHEKNKVVCLSVRTGFNLVLNALNFPDRAEIIVTDINIPDMFTIVALNKLTAVPVPVNKYTLNISVAQLEAAITPRTKAILITHLFGAIMDTTAILAIAKRNNLMVVEDCAQAFSGDEYKGNSESDVVMFSFGLIKTNTAVSGAVLQINNPDLFTAVSRLNSQLNAQSTKVFFKKSLKAILIKLITSKLIYTTLYKISIIQKRDIDEVLSGFTRGFPGLGLLQKIMYRPCNANVKLLERKLKNFDQQSVKKRRNYAKAILAAAPKCSRIGYQNSNHSHWVLPVEIKDDDQFINRLRANGFDATKKASSLIKLQSATPSADIDLQLHDLVYLPMCADMSKTKRMRLINLLSPPFA